MLSSLTRQPSTSGKVNRYICQIWESENPCEVMLHECGTRKLNVSCAIKSEFLIGPFIFEEAIVTCLNMLKNYAIIQILQGASSSKTKPIHIIPTQ
jgi:hypothetical protein